MIHTIKAEFRKVLTVRSTYVLIFFMLVLEGLFGFYGNLGVQAGGHPIVHQSLSLGDLWWRVPIAAWGISIFALLLAFIIRSQVGAITVLLLLPSTIEPIFGGLLKDNQIYLPFSSLVGILQRNEAVHPPISYGHSAVIAFTYLVVGTVVALVLFQRRDAN
jgi:hypothetical protein